MQETALVSHVPISVPEPTKQTQVDAVLLEIRRAAEEGCLDLVREGLDKIGAYCKVLQAKEVRVKAGSQQGCGGLSYRPEFMLWSVLFADKLTLVLVLAS